MAWFGFIDRSILYFPGCYSSAFLKNKAENYRKILKKLNINFWLPKTSNFFCCGGFLDENGYEKQFRKLARDNFTMLAKLGVRKILASCSLCYTIFSEGYKEVLPDWNIEVEYVLETILKKLLEDNNLIKNYSNEDIAYYDSCYLGRYSKIHQQPRDILKLFGYRIIELPDAKEETTCCGSCGNLPYANPELSRKIARSFIESLKRKRIKKIITADARAYRQLKENLAESEEEQLEIIEFSDAICEALNISSA